MSSIEILVTSAAFTVPSNQLSADAIAESVVWGIIALLTVITNSCLLYILIKKRHLKIVSRPILISIAIASILFAILYILPRWSIPNIYHNPILCHILPVLGQSFILTINFHVWIIAVDRYIFIVHPQRHRAHCTRTTTWTILLVVWIITLLMPFVPLMTYSPIDPKTCDYIVQDNLSNEIFYLTYFIVFFFVPLIIITVVYIGILIMLHSKQKRYRQQLSMDTYGLTQKHHIKNGRTLAHMLTFIGVFVIFWLPFVLTFLILQLRPKTDLQLQVLKVTQYIAFSYPAFNPIIYSYFTLKIRREIFSMFRQCKNKLGCNIACIPYCRSAAISPEQLVQERYDVAAARVIDVKHPSTVVAENSSFLDR
ncbi:Rhodopsin, GQ-coupled [Trichoplax sp. H2]|nr:Rhodopsin, GQ-coupled [Trichoplax sp. H2]|eukprot:RDD38001.1 Rhodopsin, GQ-coupled [Trichoplax sp. H2]